MRQVLKRLQTPLPHETGFNAADNPYTSSEFFKICEDYKVPNDPMRYRDEKFYWTYQHGVGWPDDCIDPNSMTRWIIEVSVGITDIGLYRILESVRAYVYLILSSQASARSGIVGNTVSALTAESAFLNNFEDIYASSKVDYSVGESIYMLPSDMSLKIKTGIVRYDNKIFVSDGNFSLGKNDEVNETPKISHQSTITHHELAKVPNITQAQKPTISHHELAKVPTHEDAKSIYEAIVKVSQGNVVDLVEDRKRSRSNPDQNTTTQNTTETEWTNNINDIYNNSTTKTQTNCDITTPNFHHTKTENTTHNYLNSNTHNTTHHNLTPDNDNTTHSNLATNTDNTTHNYLNTNSDNTTHSNITTHADHDINLTTQSFDYNVTTHDNNTTFTETNNNTGTQTPTQM